jgi:ubiquinone/menaquinone biosynthesis C-methylase UbiE
MVTFESQFNTGGAEIRRQVALESLLRRVLGGLLPEQANEAAFVSSFRRILDVGCGWGTWAVQLAETYPHLEVCGFDIDRAKISSAAHLADMQKVNERTRFRAMNLVESLDYPNESFDLVNARSVSLKTTAWPSVLSELFRITRPGGFVRFSETEDVGVTTSPIFEKLSVIFLRACRVKMISFSPTGRSMGVIPEFLCLLRRTGYTAIRKHATLLDWSTGTEPHDPIAEEMISAFQRGRSFMTGLGMASEEEVDALCRDLPSEIRADDFCALWTFYTLWGKKPIPIMSGFN